MGVSNGDDRLVHVVNVVPRGNSRDEVSIKAVRRSKSTLKGSPDGSGLHGVGDVDVGDFHAPRTGGLHRNWDVDGTVAVLGYVVVEGVDQRGGFLHDGAHRRIIAGHHR